MNTIKEASNYFGLDGAMEKKNGKGITMYIAL